MARARSPWNCHLNSNSMPRYIHIAEVASTNTYLAGTAAVLPGGTVMAK